MTAESVHVSIAPASLAPAVVCCIWRRMDSADPEPLQARVPANIYACVNLVLHGRVDVATKPAATLPEFFVTGPFTRPLPTVAEGPLHSVSLVIQPWLLRGWLGLAPADLLDALQDLGTPTACGTAGALRKALSAAAGGPAQVEQLWRALAAIGDQRARVGPPLALAELLQSGIGAAAQALRVGERQYERRFRMAMGLAPRAWLRIRRFESALVALAAHGAGTPALAGLAAAAGYSDQAHLTRDVRASTGDPPAHLRRQLLANRPGYWAFRPARVGFVQDASEATG